jgi:hypothetical protein
MRVTKLMLEEQLVSMREYNRSLREQNAVLEAQISVYKDRGYPLEALAHATMSTTDAMAHIVTHILKAAEKNIIRKEE